MAAEKRRIRTLGASLADQQRYQEAEPLVVDGYEAMTRRKATIPAGSTSALDQAGQRIVHLYRNWGKTAKAAEWTKTLERSKAFGPS